MKYNYLIIAFFFSSSFVFSQKDSLFKQIELSGAVEVYYGFDFGNPKNNRRPPFIYSYNRHNEFNLNIGFVKAAFERKRIKANLGLMVGTYPNANLNHEPGLLKNILEANVGINLSKKQNIWLELGILNSHIGFESAIGTDCWSLSRGIHSDNSPYYESGAKISIETKNEKWLVSGLILNGWQRIQRLSGSSIPSFGHQIKFTPSTKLTFNSSSFIGTDTPDSIRKMRYFHNFYGKLKLANKWNLIVGFDFGFQQKVKKSSQYDFWYTPVLMVKYSPHKKWNVTLRGEYFSDINQVIIQTNSPHGFQVCGTSLNLDYTFQEKLLIRMEVRYLNSREAFFPKGTSFINDNLAVYTAFIFSF